MPESLLKAQYEREIKKGVLKPYATVHEGLAGPLSLTLDKESSIIVTEEFGHRLTKLNHDFTRLWSIGRKGSKQGEFLYPTSVIVDSDNNYYVTDRWNHRIQKFDDGGTFLLQYGSYGNKEGELNEPWGIALLPGNEILVVDRSNARLVIFDNKGQFKKQFGHCGTSVDFYEGERFKRNFHFQNWLSNVYKLNTIESRFYEFEYEVGELEYPEDVSIDAIGDMYVTDRVGGQVVVFDAHGTVKTVLNNQRGSMVPSEPSAVFTYDDGYFIADESSNVLFWYHDAEKIIFNMDEYGIKISSMYFDQNKNVLYVTDIWNNTISLFFIETVL